MNKRDLFQSLNEIEKHLQNLLVQVSVMKEEMTDVVENLEIENQHVRDRLQELEEVTQELEEVTNEIPPKRRRSQVGLEKLYHDGYHVCQERYGARLEDQNDGCMFCLNVIDGLNYDK